MRFRKPSILIPILLGIMGFAAVTVAKGDGKKNFLDNGGFETGSLGPWMDYGSKVEVVDKGAVEGKYCAKLLPVGPDMPGKGASVIAVTVTGLKPGTSYVLSGKARVEINGDKVRVGIVGFDKSEPKMKGHAGQLIDTTDWMAFTLTFKTGVSDTSALVMLAGDMILTQGPAYGDAFDLREK